MDPITEYTGSLQCWNWFDWREEGGVSSGKVVVWPDRLEMAERNVVWAFFRPRTIPKERVRLIRPLLLLHPLHRVIQAINKRARGELINFVVSAPKEQPVKTGNIHYVFGPSSLGAAGILDVLEQAGFPVSREPIRVTMFSIGPALSQS